MLFNINGKMRCMYVQVDFIGCTYLIIHIGVIVILPKLISLLINIIPQIDSCEANNPNCSLIFRKNAIPASTDADTRISEIKLE